MKSESMYVVVAVDLLFENWNPIQSLAVAYVYQNFEEYLEVLNGIQWIQ